MCSMCMMYNIKYSVHIKKKEKRESSFWWIKILHILLSGLELWWSFSLWPKTTRRDCLSLRSTCWKTHFLYIFPLYQRRLIPFYNFSSPLPGRTRVQEFYFESFFLHLHFIRCCCCTSERGCLILAFVRLHR